MGQTLNFDLVTPSTVDITKAGQTFHLREDAPFMIVARRFRYLELLNQLQSFNAQNLPTFNDIDRLLSEMQQETLTLCAQIFAWNEQPGVEATANWSAQVDAWKQKLAPLFTFEEQNQIDSAFFTRRFGGSPIPSAASPANETVTASAASVTDAPLTAPAPQATETAETTETAADETSQPSA